MKTKNGDVKWKTTGKKHDFLRGTPVKGLLVKVLHQWHVKKKQKKHLTVTVTYHDVGDGGTVSVMMDVTRL